jgi:CRP/FNR family cyclic AMP-dependent transcriptional regulator
VPRRSALYPQLISAARRPATEPAKLADFFARRAPVLQRLPAAVLLELARAAARQRYAKGQFLCRTGDPARGVWILLEGRVSVNRSGLTGNRLCIEIMTPGDIFGLPALSVPRCPSEIQATQDSVAAAISREAVLRLVDRRPLLARELLLAIGQRLNYVETTLLLSRDPLEKRASAALVYLAHKFGPTVPLTQTEIGEMVGAAPETAMRLLKDFESRGWVRRARGGLAVTNLEAMKALIDPGA